MCDKDTRPAGRRFRGLFGIWLFRFAWRRLVVAGLLIGLALPCALLVPKPFGSLLFAATLACLPGKMILQRSGLKADHDLPGRYWLFAFVFLVLAAELPGLSRDYFALRRMETCAHVASIWLQAEHDPGTTHRITCRRPGRVG